jgi:hypothetical protein
MEVTELQTNNSLKNAFESLDLRIFYYGHTSEVFANIRKLTASLVTVFATTFLQANVLFFF